MIEEPRANIEVRMTIPPQTYMAAAQQIMGQYCNVVEEAMIEIKKDLMFNKKFQEEVKWAIKDQIRDAVENAVKSAARRVVWDTFSKSDMDIEKMVEEAIMKTLKKED